MKAEEVNRQQWKDHVSQFSEAFAYKSGICEPPQTIVHAGDIASTPVIARIIHEEAMTDGDVPKYIIYRQAVTS